MYLVISKKKANKINTTENLKGEYWSSKKAEKSKILEWKKKKEKKQIKVSPRFMSGKRREYLTEEGRDTTEIVKKRATKNASPFECVTEMHSKDL